jgi:hypothetical protein
MVTFALALYLDGSWTPGEFNFESQLHIAQASKYCCWLVIVLLGALLLNRILQSSFAGVDT